MMTKRKIKSGFVAALLVAFGIAVGSEGALAYQGHMFAARADLQAARNQLSAAVADKDGHRVNAINLIDQALVQTNQGIRSGAR